MRTALLALALALPLTAAGCATLFPEADRANEQVEQLDEIADIAREAGEDELAAETVALAAELRARLAEIAAGETTRTVDGAIDAVQNGGLLGLLALLGLTGVRARGRFQEVEDRAREALEEARREIAELERRRDESRELQGIAGASKRSIQQVTSPVAKAAKGTDTPQAIVEALAE